MTTPEVVTITSPDGRTTAGVEPGSGGRLVSLRIGGDEVIATCERSYDADYFRGSFPLAPWCGLLTDGIVHFDGQEHPVRGRSSPEGLRQYHGGVHSWPFAVDTVSTDRVEMSVPIGPDQPDQWPWAGTVRQSYQLRDDRLVIALSVHSDGAEFPGAAGYHPWFVTELDGGRRAEVDFRPGRRLEIDQTGRRRVPAPVGEDTGSGVFDQITQSPQITWVDGPSLTLEANTEVWVTYDRTAGGFCVEPWTAPDGPMDNSYVHRVTPQSPCVLDFSIVFGD